MLEAMLQAQTRTYFPFSSPHSLSSAISRELHSSCHAINGATTATPRDGGRNGGNEIGGEEEEEEEEKTCVEK